jgi:pimeloyl-ACP methyl ester carboxylesterase
MFPSFGPKIVISTIGISTQRKTNPKMTKQVFVALLIGVIAGGFSSPALANEAELALVGKHHLEVSVRGEGRHTVVFESGLGHDLAGWKNVADEVSKFAKTVSYSRAGYGQSEQSDLPRTLGQIASELDALLTAQNISPPYILVGHSAGGFYIRKYAELYPEKVAGFVFVDATPENILIRLRELDEERAVKEEAVISSMTPDRVKPEDIYFSKITQSGVYPSSAKLPDVPAAMITAMKQEYPQFLMHSAAGKEAWRDLQAQFVSQFTNYQHTVLSASGHNVHREQPEVVVAAVRYVMKQADTSLDNPEKK